MHPLSTLRLLNHRPGDGKGDLSFPGYSFKYKVSFSLSTKGKKESQGRTIVGGGKSGWNLFMLLIHFGQIPASNAVPLFPE